ncbi:MAG: glycerophosphodiester phosphodiesterase [Clostridiales bacterium]|nr:glycerophosphodiester phosphodiesterase [Clostridiales bacterium]
MFFDKYKFISHRGLHSKRLDIPENSIPAFLRSVSKNFAIELDIRMSSDDEIVVFHDESLERMTGVKGNVADFTSAELQEQVLNGTKYKIPVLSEVLRLVDGRVPILIELKNDGLVGKMEKRLVQILKGYNGEYAIQSFNPFVLLWFRINAPHIKRGQLVSGDNGLCLKKIPFNFITKPDFVSYRYSDINYDLYQRYKKANIPIICWTIRTIEDLNRMKVYCKAFIFEEIDKFNK